MYLRLKNGFRQPRPAIRMLWISKRKLVACDELQQDCEWLKQQQDPIANLGAILSLSCRNSSQSQLYGKTKETGEENSTNITNNSLSKSQLEQVFAFSQIPPSQNRATECFCYIKAELKATVHLKVRITIYIILVINLDKLYSIRFCKHYKATKL